MIEGAYVPGAGILWCGVVYSLADLANNFDIDRQVLARRLKRGMSVEKALCVPFRKRKKPSPRKIAEKNKERKFVGKVCKCGNSVRYTINDRCVSCHCEKEGARRAKKKLEKQDAYRISKG